MLSWKGRTEDYVCHKWVQGMKLFGRKKYKSNSHFLKNTHLTDEEAIIRNSYFWEYAFEMLIVPLSIVSSWFFILSSTTVHSVTRDLFCNKWDWGQVAVLSASDAGTGESGDDAMPVLPKEKMLRCIIGRTGAVLVLNGGSLSLEVVAVFMSDSTRFCPLIGMAGETKFLFSSNFAGKTDAEVDSGFMPREWSMKPSAIWDWLCYTICNDITNGGNAVANIQCWIEQNLD